MIDATPEHLVDTPTSATPPSVGRPRRFDDETERRMLMDSAMATMTRDGYADTSVGDILADAGLSTRAFYRHFESKESLLLALVMRDTESVRRMLDTAVTNARDPVAAVEAWIDRYLDVFYEPRRSARTDLFSAAAAHASSPLVVDAHARMRNLLCAPLIDVLRAAHQAGVLHSPTPEADAVTLGALVATTAERGTAPIPSRHAARAHIKRFAWPAFGLPLDDHRRPDHGGGF